MTPGGRRIDTSVGIGVASFHPSRASAPSWPRFGESIDHELRVIPSAGVTRCAWPFLNGYRRARSSASSFLGAFTRVLTGYTCIRFAG